MQIDLSSLVFRPMDTDDLPFFVEVRNDCSNVLHNSFKFNLSQAVKWFPTSTTYYWIVHHKSMKSDIGYIRQLYLCESSTHIKSGLDLHPKFRGVGLGYLAWQEYIKVVRCFYPFISALELEVLSHNNIALSLYKKLGFIQTHVDVGVFERDGITIDSIHLTLLL